MCSTQRNKPHINLLQCSHNGTFFMSMVVVQTEHFSVLSMKLWPCATLLHYCSIHARQGRRPASQNGRKALHWKRDVFLQFFFFSVVFKQCFKWKGRPCAGKHKNKSSQGWLFLNWALSQSHMYSTFVWRALVVKDLGKDICKVVGSNPCVVNHELGTVVK